MDLYGEYLWRWPASPQDLAGLVVDFVHKFCSLSPEMERAVWFSGMVCISLILSHLATVLYIAYHDINGYWDKYSLKYQKSTWWTYTQHAYSFFFDVTFLLAPSLVAFGYYYDEVVSQTLLVHGEWRKDVTRILVLSFSTLLNNIINRLWAMAVHWLMHEHKALYKLVHKRHHCQIRDLCASSAWQDTTLEFVLMEVLGVFLFAQFFNPLPWHFHVLLASYNGIGGAIDHSAFYIPGTCIDGRYHWDHHLRIDYNFSEIEFLDKMFGTLYERSPSDDEVFEESSSEKIAPRFKMMKDQKASVTVDDVCSVGTTTAPPSPSSSGRGGGDEDDEEEEEEEEGVMGFREEKSMTIMLQQQQGAEKQLGLSEQFMPAVY